MTNKSSFYSSVSGTRLSECRKAAGMTQETLAAAAGYSKGYISNLETGKKHMTTDAALTLGKILSVRFEYLLGDDPFKSEASIPQHLRKNRFKDVILLNGLAHNIADMGDDSYIVSWQGHAKMEYFLCTKENLDSLAANIRYLFNGWALGMVEKQNLTQEKQDKLKDAAQNQSIEMFKKILEYAI